MVPHTLPDLQRALTARGWGGAGTGSIDSTVSNLVTSGWLRQAGVVERSGKRSSQYELVPTRREEVSKAVRRNAAFRLDEGVELVLLPLEAIDKAAVELAQARRGAVWGFRTQDPVAGLVVILDPTASSAERDVLAGRLARVGGRRISVQEVLPPIRLRAYIDALGSSLPQTLPESA